MYYNLRHFAIDSTLEPEEKEEKARLLNDFGYALSALGSWEEAFLHAQEALEIRRQLAHSNPSAFLPDLAMSLGNLSIRLSDLGLREEALLPAQEGLEIRRQLSYSNPAAFPFPTWPRALELMAACYNP